MLPLIDFNNFASSYKIIDKYIEILLYLKKS